MSRETEHETFAALHDNLGRALDNIQTLAALRPGEPWDAIHARLKQMKELIYNVAMKGKQ